MATDAKKAAKNLKLGLPLNKKEISALAEMFCKGEYYGHVEFGLSTGRLYPEDLIKNMLVSNKLPLN